MKIFLSVWQAMDGRLLKPLHAANPNNLDIFVSYLRKKIREYSDFDFITTVRGVGFKMEEQK